MTANTGPEEQQSSGPGQRLIPGEAIGEAIGAACVLSMPCVALALTARMAAVALVPGLNWPTWAVALVGVAAAGLLVLLAATPWFDDDNLELWVGIPVIVAFVAVIAWGATSLLMRGLGVPIWLSVVLGVALGILLYFLVVLMGNTTLLEAAMQCSALLLLIAILLPVFQTARETAQMRRERGRPPVSVPLNR